MKCKNCGSRFGLMLDMGIENEMIGRCLICDHDVCVVCVFTRIETPEVNDPGAICRSCVAELKPKQAVA